VKKRFKLSNFSLVEKLISSLKQLDQDKALLPFAVYSSIKEQHIVNVPIVKPLLICVLSGRKQLGDAKQLNCLAGDFVFLTKSAPVEMRNIPGDSEYLALIIEFEFKDFACFQPTSPKTETFFQGKIAPLLQRTLQQFVDWSAFAPAALWPLRRQEILQLIHHLGHEQIASVVESPGISHKLHALISAEMANDLPASVLSARLAMSESTLRRKLTAEGTSLQAIKDSAKLGYGLHLVQTTFAPIGQIAGQCGYQSQSRFTKKFKQLFRITPSELRKTRLSD
jgi:AraC-like DNA-binding protein